MLSEKQWEVLDTIDQNKRVSTLDIHLGTLTALYVRDLIDFTQKGEALLTSFGRKFLAEQQILFSKPKYREALPVVKGYRMS